MFAQTAIWHRITVDNPELSHGKQLADFLGEAFKHISVNVAFVLLYEAEGGGDPIRGITQLDCIAISISELMDRLQHTDQLDWATLCFSQDLDEQKIYRICNERSIIEAVASSLLAVRVIDNSYLDIFTCDDQFKNYLVEQYPATKVESSALDRMVFPE